MPTDLSPDLLPNIATFARVAHHASFTRAAAELGVSPSAVSQTVRLLEQQLGVRLLNRSTRRVGVTEVGERFLKDTAQNLAGLASAVAQIDETRDRPAGILRINSSRVAADILLRTHLGDFAEAYPDITLELTCDNRLLDLVAGGFDAGIRLGESLAQDVVAVPLGGPLRMVVFATPGYLKGRAPLHKPADLPLHRCMGFRMSTGALYRWEFEKAGRAFDMEVPAQVISNDNGMLLEAVRAGAGIGYAFEREVQRDFEQGTLVPLLKPWWPTFPGFHLYYSSRTHLPRKLRVFIDFLRERHRPA